MAKLKNGEYTAENTPALRKRMAKLNAELCAKASRAIHENEKKARYARAMIYEIRRKRDLGLLD